MRSAIIPTVGWNIQGLSTVCNLHDVGLCCDPRRRWHSPVTAADGPYQPLVAYVGWESLRRQERHDGHEPWELGTGPEALNLVQPGLKFGR